MLSLVTLTWASLLSRGIHKSILAVREEVERRGGHAQKMPGKSPRSMGAWSTGDGGPIDHHSHLREDPKGNPVA